MNTKKRTSNGRVTHMPGDYTMNLIMYGLQRVTRATTISRRVVTETGPSMNTCHKIIDTCGDITLGRRQVT